MNYSAGQPTGGPDRIANWVGAVFDADNLCGSGVNADGGANNGAANDDCTYVAADRPIQGQTFTTGTSANGYEVRAVTVRSAGYTNNTATGSNRTFWNLNFTNAPIIITVSKINGDQISHRSIQLFKAGSEGSPGSGGSANGPGDFITFELPFTVHLEPDTLYGFDLFLHGNGSNYFEWLGTASDAYAGGTAYTRSGRTITPLTGDRVFMLDITEAASSEAPFQHPGTLHTQEDLDRMATQVAGNISPWSDGYSVLTSSPLAQTGWSPAPVETIIRGGTGGNYTRSQRDAQAIYELALRWHVSGDTAYADRAVYIANAWSSTLTGTGGDTNGSLGAGICGYLFAVAGDLLSTYPGWAQGDREAYQEMLQNVFYPANIDFLWRHHDTPVTKGGNTHYRLNWDTFNMTSIAAIGIACDNRAIYEQAIDYFKYGTGNGRIERAAWYLHPDGGAQTEEVGRDQGHNMGGWASMVWLCQMAWNQGDDLFAYDDFRVLRAVEYITRYNLFEDVPWVYHRNCDITYTETLSESQRGNFKYFMWELIYNHYERVRGMGCPYSEQAASQTRPEPAPNLSGHPSQVDWFGLGTLTFTQATSAATVPASGLIAQWSGGQITLSWLGSARAIGYCVQRSTTPGGPYTLLAANGVTELSYVDTDVVDGATYHYVVTSYDRRDEWTSEELTVRQELVAHYPFDGNTDNVVGGCLTILNLTDCMAGPDVPVDPTCTASDLDGDGDCDLADASIFLLEGGSIGSADENAILHGGSTGLPGYVTGHNGGLAIDLDGVDDFVQLPVGIANYQDITVAAWVNWDGGAAWQRIFDFGTEIEKNMYLTPSTGGVMRFRITTSRENEGTGTLEGSILPTNQWVHVAVTLNGDTGTLYVNGLPIDTETIAEVDPLFSQPYCYIGRSMWNPDPLFSGCIDDFRIYNYALSSAAINGLATGTP